jgi:hypothetical protein
MNNRFEPPFAYLLPPLAAVDRVRLLMEEYRAMYGLLSLRLAVVDQRVPLAAGALMVVLSSLTALPPGSQLVVLLAAPVAMSWLLRMTVTHAQSKEDVLRRIDEIERQANQLAGEELLTFQSRHPNRRESVSGRTGTGAVSSVLALCLAGLLGCVAIVLHRPLTPPQFLLLYVAYIAVSVLDLLSVVLRLRGYRYNKAPPFPCPVSRILANGRTTL